MAESLNSTRRLVFKEPTITVKVDHASDDLLVVSYPYKSRLFQGILLDSTNRYLPCAYPSPEVVKWSPPRVVDIKDPSSTAGEPAPAADRAFYSLSNRFTYFQDVLFQKNVALVKSAKQAKAKAQKMTVRLRPRQVLCSKCRSICNENSENVRSPGSAKKEEKPDKDGGGNDSQNDEVKSPRKKVRTTLVTKLSKLEPDDVRAVNGSQGEAGRVWSEMLEADKQMVLRKKRSVGSMEDLWDETVFEEASKKAKTTPIIKISFGSPGEGTVLKIPPKVRLSGSEGEEEEDKGTTETTKSFKKALKKAKKEAKRKVSPEREEDPSPEEPNYKKHRHRVKHKKRHKNSKEEDVKDKCLKQKLSISLRRVCGPGEEESWSGESSRSSEPVKDSEDLKSDLNQDLLQELPSGLNLEDTQHFKETTKGVTVEPAETTKGVATDPVETTKGVSTEPVKTSRVATTEPVVSTKGVASESLTPKRNRRVGAQKRKKSEPTESVNKENPPQEVIERLGEPALKPSETSVSCFDVSLRPRTRQEPARSLKLAQNSVHSKKAPDKTTKTKNITAKEKKCSNTLSVLKLENLSATKDVSKGEDLINIVNNELIVPETLIKTEECELKPDTSDSTLESTKEDNVPIEEVPKVSVRSSDPVVKEDKKSAESTLRIDDTLDDNLISEDSMPELDQTTEDALLESDKEMPEELENQRIESLSDIWESEREIPVLTRMVDPEEVASSNVSLSRFKSSPSKDEGTLEDNEETNVSEIKLDNFESKSPKDLGGLEEDCPDIKVAELSLTEQSSLKTEDCISSNRTVAPLSSDVVVDSSEDLEFLPAEDYFDETLDGEIPLRPENVSSELPKIKSSSFDLELDEVSKKCVRSSDLKSFENCLSPKTPLDFELKQNTLESTESPLETSLHEVKSSKSVPDPSSLTSEKGCEIEKTLNSLPDSPSLDQSVLISSSSQAKSLSSPPCNITDPSIGSLSSFASKFSQDKSSDLGDDTLPLECHSNLALEKGKNVELVSSSRMSPLKDVTNPESLDHLYEEAMDIVPSFTESSIAASCLEVSSSETVSSKVSPSSPLDKRLDCTDALSADGCSDSVPDFPESSSQGAPHEVTSCQTLDGFVLNVGDIVWAKIHGFPWWPAKVTRLSAGRSGTSGCDARVAWFGSATSTLMSSDQLSPFIQTFKAKYNSERKSTGYLEAIRQATSEASSDFQLPTPLAEIDKLAL